MGARGLGRKKRTQKGPVTAPPGVSSRRSLPHLTPFLSFFPPVRLQENKVVRPAKMTAEEMEEEAARERAMAAMVCSLENKDACVMCSG